jgi:hypothetical protein
MRTGIATADDSTWQTKLTTAEQGCRRGFSAARDFPDAWHQFLNTETAPFPLTLDLDASLFLASHFALGLSFDTIDVCAIVNGVYTTMSLGLVSGGSEQTLTVDTEHFGLPFASFPWSGSGEPDVQLLFSTSDFATNDLADLVIVVNYSVAETS